MLAIIDTHPIQYHVPVYRAVAARGRVPIHVIFGSDYSVGPHHDGEFGAAVSWDVDLTGGYSHEYLSRTAVNRPHSQARATGRGITAALGAAAPRAVLLVGYSPSFHQRAWLASIRHGAPILFRGETTDLPPRGRPWMRAMRDAVLRRAYRRAARVLYIGARSRRHYEQRGVEDHRLVFSPYCVDLAPFAPTEADRLRLRGPFRAAHGWSDTDLVLAFSGKLSERKGVDLITHAVRGLPEPARARTVVAVAGDGALREAIAADAARDPRVRVHILGVQSQGQLSAVYHASDVLLLPSRWGETWGLVVNEALHHGLPVVVSGQVGCAPDLVDADTGVVVPPEAAALTAGIVQALRLAGREDIRATCRRKVAAYSVDRAADAIADAYRAVTGAER